LSNSYQTTVGRVRNGYERSNRSVPEERLLKDDEQKNDEQMIKNDKWQYER